MTNGDKIRSMTDDELAIAWSNFYGCSDCPCFNECEDEELNCAWHVRNWLQKEVE